MTNSHMPFLARFSPADALLPLAVKKRITFSNFGGNFFGPDDLHSNKYFSLSPRNMHSVCLLSMTALGWTRLG